MKASRLKAALIVAFALGFIVPQPAAAQGTSYIFILAPQYYLFTPISVYTGMNVTFLVSSNASVDVYLLSGTQLQSFEQGFMTGYIYHGRGSSVTGNVGPLVRGTYYLLIYNDIQNLSAEVTYKVSTIPVNIYAMHRSLPAPVGIADYGVLNRSGVLVPYVERFSEVVGMTTIYALRAYNSTPPPGISPYSASVQLNAVLMVNYSSGVQYYWLQNVILFNTNNDTMQLLNDVWNLTSRNSVLYAHDIIGRGTLKLVGLDDVYLYGTPFRSYTLPLTAYLFIKESWTPSSVMVSFGYSNVPGTVSWFNNASIELNGIRYASLLVDGYSMNPRGTFIDAELVFGGGGNGGWTYFTQMNSTLSMWYVLPNGSVQRPIMLYGFGSDTVELADNLKTVYSNGAATVTIGSGNFEPLMSQKKGAFTVKAEVSTGTYYYGQPVNVRISALFSNGVAPYSVYLLLNGTPVGNYTTYLGFLNRTFTMQVPQSGTYVLRLIFTDGINETFTSGPYYITVSQTWIEENYPTIYSIMTYASLGLAALGLYISFGFRKKTLKNHGSSQK
ncbi:MAG: thermopsin [Nitrososphaeria archaeon]